MKYEDGDSEEMTEKEAFSAARAYRDYLRHKDAIDSGAMYQIAIPRKITRRKAARSVQPSVHTIPVEETASAQVTVTPLIVARAPKENLIRVCAIVCLLLGFVLVVYNFVSRFIREE